MKLVVLVAAAAIALLAGCSSDPVVTTATPVTTAAPTTTMQRGAITDQDRVFLAQLNDHWTRGIDRGQLFDAGEKACAQMRAGEKLQVIAIMSGGEKQPDGSVRAASAGLNNAANFVYAAALAYCPDQLTGVN
jgi:hypothetical protein